MILAVDPDLTWAALTIRCLSIALQHQPPPSKLVACSGQYRCRVVTPPVLNMFYRDSRAAGLTVVVEGVSGS